MFPRSSRSLFAAIFAIVFAASVLMMSTFGPFAGAEGGTEVSSGIFAPTITATKTDSLVATGNNGDGRADPGDEIDYTVTVQNGAAPGAGNDATNLALSDTIDANTTLDGGSLASSPVGVNDTFPVTVLGNVSINSATITGGPFRVTANDYLGLNPVATIDSFDATSANGGNVTMVQSGANMGEFTYNPPPGFEGTDTFTYTLTDNGNASSAASNRTATVSITVSGMIWFVNNAAAACTTLAAGCGRLSNPFSSLEAFQALNNGTGNNPADGDNIFIYESATAYTGGVTLLNNQKLIGQDSTGTLATITGLTPPTGSAPLPAMNAGAPATTIQNGGGNGVTLGTGNTLNGFTASNSTGSAILGNAFVTVNVNDVIVNTNAQALSLTNGASGAGGVNFTSITSTGGTNCVSLQQLTGTFNLGGGALSASSGACFVVGGAAANSGGSATVNYSGTVTKSAGGRVVAVTNKTSGVVTLLGQVTGTGTGTGIRLDSNGTATINFIGGLVMSTSTGDAFSATGGGTVNVCDENPCNPGATGGLVNTLTTTTGTTLNVVNTTIGANNLEFRSISSNGAANGIVLNTTGAIGGLKVKGNGGTCTDANTSGCTGGVVQNSTGGDDSTATPIGTGIVLNNTAGVSLTRMYIHDHSNYGIRGTSVNGFTLDNSVVSGVNGTNVATPFNDGSLSFDNLSGTSAITNSAISGGFQRNVRVDNTTGTLTLTVNSNSIHNTGNSAGDDGLFVEIGGGTATLSVTNNTFAAHGGDHFNLSLLGSPTVGLTFTGNVWTGGHPIGLGQGLFILAASFDSPGLLTYNISNNGTVGNPLVGNNSGGAIHVNKGSGTGSFSGTISSNVIGNPAVNSSGSLNASGIDVEVHGSGGSHTTAITNNQVRQFHNDGILLLAGEGNAVFNATVTDNIVTNPDASVASFHGMQFNIGTLPTDGGTHCLDVKNNALTTAGNEGNGGVDLRIRQRQVTTVRLPGYGGANNDNAAVQTFLTATNTNSVTTILASNSVPSGGGFIGGAACTQPSFAEPADEITVNAAGALERTLNFLNASYQSPFEIFGSKFNVQSSKLEVSRLVSGQNVTAALEGSVSIEDEVSADTRETGVWVAIKEIAGKLTSAIVPTVKAESIAPMSGETVNVAVGTLPAGKSVTVKFQVTVDGPPLPLGTTRILNQGTVTADGGINVLTTDPAPNADPACTAAPAIGTKTCTPVDRPDTTVSTINRVTSSPTNEASVEWTITFADAIGGLAASNLSLVDTTTSCTGEALGTITPVGGSPATQWTVLANTGTGDCTLRLDLASDLGLSHDVTNAPFITGQTIEIDKTPPSTTSFVRFNPLSMNTNADVLVFRATFSEAVIGVDPGDFVVNGTTTATVVSFTFVGGGPTFTQYDITVSGGDLAGFNGPVGLNLSGTQITDLAGNPLPNTEPAIDETYNVDNVPPTVDITDVSPDPRNTDVSSITIVFSEPITGFDLNDLTLTLDGGGNVLTGAQTLTSGDNITWTLGNLSGITAAEGTYLLTLAVSDITDQAGNALAAGATDEWIMDTTAPTVTINQAAGQSDPTPNNPINFTVVFSEPVTDFDDASDVDLSTSTAGGTLTATITEIAPNDGTTYNVAVNGAVSDGTVIATVNAGAAVDAAGNVNTASTSTDNSVTFITCATPPSGMVAWWTGDGNARDIAGGHDGTLVGDATYAAGKVGDAFSFDGTGDYVEVPDADSLDITGAITIDAWVNPAAANASGMIVDKGGSSGYALELVSGSPKLTVGGVSATSVSVLAANTWTHVAASFNGSNIVIYVNGVPETSSASGAIPVNASTLQIGTGFAGLIDEVEVFNVALDEPAVDALVAADSGGKCKPADLEISKSDGGVSTTPGGTITYTLSYGNYGAAASGTLTETVPANTTFSSAGSTAGWSCANGSPATTVCTLSVGSLGTGATGSAAFVVTVVNPIPAGVTQISNTASIAGGTEMNTADNSSTDTTPVTATPDLSLTKSDGGASVAPAGTVAYTLTYTNNGNQGATGIVLTETVPANTTFNSGASTAGWNCSPNGNAGSTCTLAVAGAVAGGGGNGSATFAVTVVNPVAAGVSQISNTASVADDGTNGTDPTLPNTASDTTPVNAAPDLTIDKDDGGVSTIPGGTVTYTLNYSNVGNQGATGVVITETVPANTTFDAGSSTSGWVCTPNNNAGSTCTFTVGALAAAGTGSVTFAVTLPTTGLSGVTQISNTATIADDGANGTDPNLPNSSTDTTPRGCQTITVNNPTNASGTIGIPFSETFTQTGGFGTVTYATSSTLPSGFTLSSAGVLSGTTTQTGSFPITVTATDGNGCTGTSATYNLSITCNIDPEVLNNLDSGDDSLRWAVLTACPGSTITFASPLFDTMQTIPINGRININKSLTINGRGPDLTIINNIAPTGASNVIQVNTSGTVDLSGLTITGGNYASEGAGIGNLNSTLTLTNTVVSGNTVDTSGASNGGGISNINGMLTVVNSTVSGNTINGNVTAGGGIYNVNGTVTLTNSTVSGNITNGNNNRAAGIFNEFNGTLILTNSTVSGNTANNAPGVGGIASLGTLTMTNSTVSNNNAAVGGCGGIDIAGSTSRVRNSIVSGNLAAGNPNNLCGSFTISDANIVGDEANINLGPLASNGGPTQTHALLFGSSAIDQGNGCVLTASCAVFNAPAALTTDQRGTGYPRQAQAAVDIGAYELNIVPTKTTVTSSANPSVWGQTVTFTATVETDPGGAPVTVGNVDFSLDGNPVAACQNVALNGSGQAQCAISGLALGGHTILAEFDENLPFLASSGSLLQTVNQANTTIVITGDTPDPSLIGDPYVVTWTVAVVAPGAGTPTGVVTVTDGTGGTCTAPVAAGFCTLTSTTVGVKNLVATYSGDTFFNASTSAAAQHTVVIRISGTIRHFPGMTGLAGITVTLQGANGGGLALTNSNGDYTFFGPFSGNYTVTPSGPIPGKSYDPITRSLNNVTGHTTGIDFVAYDTSTDAPRKLKVISQFAVPGTAVAVPVTIESQGNETSISFSIQYDPAIYSAPPTVGCGTDAGPGCQITTNYSQTGKVGIRVVPASVPLAAGTREIVVLTFQTQPTLASNTPIDLIVTPTNISATNANGDLLLVELFSGGLIVMQQGFEGDVANILTGDGQVLSNDVIVARQFAVGTRTADPAYNEFQRVDTAPAATKGDGMITSADVIQARRYASGISSVTDAGGPFVPMAAAPPPAMLTIGEADRAVRAMPVNGVAGYQVTVPVEMKTTGDEMAVSFTFEYDAMKLGNPKVTLAGVAPADAVVTVNDTESGRLTILVDAGTPFSNAGGHLLNVTFDVAQTAPAGETKIAIKGGSVSDAEANELEAAYVSGTVTINGANAPSVRISGRVLTPTGGGLRNAQVTITDADGARRTVPTSSAGYYQFDAVAAGRQYRLSVSSRRYRFATRTVEISADLADIDFIAQE